MTARICILLLWVMIGFYGVSTMSAGVEQATAGIKNEKLLYSFVTMTGPVAPLTSAIFLNSKNRLDLLLDPRWSWPWG